MSDKQRGLNSETHGGNRGLQDGRMGFGLSPSAREYSTDRAARQARVILYNERGAHVASIDPDHVLRKRVSGSQHRLRFPFPAWALDVAHLEAAEAAGCQAVEITDADDGAVYRARLADFRQFGRPLDRGHGPQVALAVGRFAVSRPAAPGAPVQLALFGAV